MQFRSALFAAASGIGFPLSLLKGRGERGKFPSVVYSILAIEFLFALFPVYRVLLAFPPPPWGVYKNE